ncbi:AEC family transporter [Marinobacteraceae bacterium S3BR75-40.1]
MLLEHLAFALGIVAPIFLVLVVGIVLRRQGVIDEAFINTASRLVFNLALPALIFVNLAGLELSDVVEPAQLLLALAVTVIGFVILWHLSGAFIPEPENRGTFVQGAFRGNLGIVGIALCANLYGQAGLAMGSMLLAVLTLAYNLLSIYALSAGRGSGAQAWLSMLRGIIRNPLILSILAGVSVAALGWQLPAILTKSLDYFAAMTLPLALLCVGATITLGALRHSSRLTLWAVLLKLVILPGAYTGAALAWGFQGPALGTLFAMFAAPTATVSYIMARAMGGNADLAANLVALTTLFSPLSLSLGLSLLSALQLL